MSEAFVDPPSIDMCVKMKGRISKMRRLEYTDIPKVFLHHMT
jgi:hypothetical protein